jgi:hypothetical protein
VTSVSAQAEVRITKVATSVVAGAEQTSANGTLQNTSAYWRSYTITLRPSAGLPSSVTVNAVAPGQAGVWQATFAGQVGVTIAAIAAAAAPAGPALSPANVRLTVSGVVSVCPAGPCSARQVSGTMVNPDNVQHQMLVVNMLASDGSAVTGGVFNLPPGQTGNWRATFSSNVDAAHLGVAVIRIEAFM